MQVSMPPVTPGDPIRVSASTYLAWKRCPESANARLQGIFGPDTRPAFLGSLAHRIFSRHLTSGPIASEDFARACKEEIGGSALNNKLAGLDLRPSALAAVIEELRGLYDRFTKLDEEGFEGSEVDVSQELDGDVELVGTIDAVYSAELGGHRLVDWKTGELGQPDDQLLFYALLWALSRQMLPASVEAVSVRTGERYRTVPSTADVAAIAEDVSLLVNRIRESWAEGTSLERHGGPWCKFCPLLSDCDEGRSAEALLSG